MKFISIYTDASHNQNHNISSYAFLLANDGIKEVYSDLCPPEITKIHQAELLAVYKSILEAKNNNATHICIHTDCHCVIHYLVEKNKRVLRDQCFIDLIIKTKKLLSTFEGYKIFKIKAHKQGNYSHNCNREVDKLSRKTLRNYIKVLNKN